VTLVLDSSVTLAWVYSDEVTPAVEDIFQRVVVAYAVVPSIWRLEVANALQMGIRRGRMNRRERDETLFDLSELDIRPDVSTDALAWKDTISIADRHALTVYDASYLELAQRLALLLATLDRKLRQAAEDRGIAVLGA
jgi:predicted nucleic acid-binding protein